MPLQTSALRDRSARLRKRSVPALVVGLTALSGCAPTLDVLGVYFPGWLVCATSGIILAYAAVRWLARRPGTRALGQSGVLFCSLTISASLLLWWLFFSHA